MVWTTGVRMELAWLGLQIQTRQVACGIGRALPVVVSVWARKQCRGSVGNRSPLH